VAEGEERPEDASAVHRDRGQDVEPGEKQVEPGESGEESSAGQPRVSAS
jgi:hypothetical protein